MKKNIAIIGAGITGLTLGWKLSEKFNVTIIEKEKYIGGMCSSFKHNNFILDYGPHKLYPQKESVHREIKNLYLDNPSEILHIKKKSSIFLQKNFFNYPLEIKQAVTKFSPILAGTLLISYGLSAFKAIVSKNSNKESYEQFLINKFGKVMYSLVFKENAEKIWGNPKKLSSDLAKTRVSSPNLFKVILQTILKTKDPKLNAESFLYPKNSILNLSERMSQIINKNKGAILTDSQIESISIKDNRVNQITIKTPKGIKKITCEYVISTANIKDILPRFNPPKNIIENVEKLKFRGLALVYVFLNKEIVLKDNWIFFPEKEFIFQRISEQKSFSNFNQPKDKSVITAEISLRPEIEKNSEEELSKKVINDLEKAGVVLKKDIFSTKVIKKQDVYPIYHLDYKTNLNRILYWLDNNIKNFVTCGRNGLFNYNNMDHCIDMAIKIAEHLKTKNSTKGIEEMRKYFDSYKIID